MTDMEAKEESAAVLHAKDKEVANVCKQAVLKASVTISGKKYIQVEGWQTIAMAHGCILSARDVEKVDSGIRGDCRSETCPRRHSTVSSRGLCGRRRAHMGCAA